MYYVYRFLDKKQNVIYVGKSKMNLESRFKNHTHLPKECYSMVHKIQYIICKTESDMSIKEIFYINKYKNSEHYFYNISDTTGIPKSIKFDDKWKMYRGALPENFSHSINFKKGYITEKETKYNKDGTIDKRKTNKKKGISSYVEGFTSNEIDLIIAYLIEEINKSENNNQEQIRFRNLVMFVLGVNIPLKPSDFLLLKYDELFDKKDKIKDYTFQTGRHNQNEIIKISLGNNVKKLLSAYRKKYDLSYEKNGTEPLFISRKHQVVSLIAWGRIISESAEAIKIKKNIGAESLRKSYGLNIYKNSRNKMKALAFLGELWGQIREVKIIQYLGLINDEIDFDYYLSETFALGNVDLSKIKCLN